jgi:hypothetical protein
MTCAGPGTDNKIPMTAFSIVPHLHNVFLDTCQAAFQVNTWGFLSVESIDTASDKNLA